MRQSLQVYENKYKLSEHRHPSTQKKNFLDDILIADKPEQIQNGTKCEFCSINQLR